MFTLENTFTYNFTNRRFSECLTYFQEKKDSHQLPRKKVCIEMNGDDA